MSPRVVAGQNGGMTGLRDPAAATASSVPGRARLHRRHDRRLAGGVAGGIGDHLSVPVAAVRLAFVLLSASGGLGIILYAAYWIVVPVEPGEQRRRRLPQWVEVSAAVVLGALALYTITRTVSVGGGFVPAALALLGAALIWRQATDVERRRWTQWSQVSLAADPGGRIGRIRLVGGVLLVLLGATLVLARADLGQLRDALFAVVVTVVGVVLITGPWWVRIVRDLDAERYERARSDERADLAAHLHDSVLQTLALIQRSADSPREVARLARSQERELRTLLFARRLASGRLADTLRSMAGEVEDTYAVGVEAVVVGDAPVTDASAAVVAATREALINAATHAGVTSVSLYAEIDGATCTVYVRDRGSGFDPAHIGADRHGISESIIERVARHGGRATVRSVVGAGTEVQIGMPLHGQGASG